MSTTFATLSLAVATPPASADAADVRLTACATVVNGTDSADGIS